MSKQNYIEIKPKHCSKCGKDYTPIIHSDECPHNKVDVSEQKGLDGPRLLDLYCKWCPREQECDEHLSLEEKRGCVACGGFADELVLPRLDRPELREKINGVLNQYIIHNLAETIMMDDDWITDQLLALVIPNIEEADALREIITYLEAKIKEAKEQFREWGFSACPHNPSNLQARKAYCPECWQSLLEEG